MTITIDNLTVADNAVTGTTIGTLTAIDINGGIVACNFRLMKGTGKFAISTDKLVTAWTRPLEPGAYSVRVRADGITRDFASSATFTVKVESAPTPTAITFSPTAASLFDNAPAGTTVAAVLVTTSNGSAFSGALAASPRGVVGISGNNLVLTRALTSADDGSHQWSVAAAQNGVTLSGAIKVVVMAASPPPAPPAPPPPPPSVDGTAVAPGSGLSVYTRDGSWSFGAFASDGINAAVLLNGKPAQGWFGHRLVVDDGGKLYVLGVTRWWVWQAGQFVESAAPPSAPLPYPTAITLTLAQSTISDNAPAGTIVATATVTTSDGTRFTGTLTSSDTGFFAISGLNIVTARALTSADDGTHTTTIAAHQGSQSLSAELSI